MSWDSNRVKAQLRYATQQLVQLQLKLLSQAPITKKDIATLLQQDNIILARAKAQNVIKEEIRINLLQALESYFAVVLEHFGELEKREITTPALLEAASSITFAASQVDIKELHATRDLLVQRLGPDFAHKATGNKDQYVSARVIRALSAPPPSAARLDDYLSRLAADHGVQWAPDFRPHEKLMALSEMLDIQASPVVDLPRLRRICATGLPDHPSWLRPRVWRILLGSLPVLKSAWANDAGKQRDSYYDLVRRLLEPLTSSPLPSTSLSPSDTTLVRVYKQLSRVPPNLYYQLEEEPESFTICPLNEDAPDHIRISCANNLDLRLEIITGRGPKSPDSDSTPEIRLEVDENTTPDIAVTAPESVTSQWPSTPTMLYQSPSYGPDAGHKKHMSALLRLLYIHSCLNPANHSPHMASILIPLYSVLNTEVEIDDLAHVEADTFWLFEAIVGDFSELEDEEGGNLWMKKFGERLAWADSDLLVDLQLKGLDPSLPHYSYRWLAPLLTHTLPLSSVWMSWDVLFSRPMRERHSNAKLDSLLDICTSMLIRARAPLFRLGKSGLRSPGLWTEENNSLPLSPVRAWELNDAFLEGMSLLQLYPIEAAGGIDTILQMANDLRSRREAQLKTTPNVNSSLGTRLRDTMWRGFTNQMSSIPSSPSLSPVDSDEDIPSNESIGSDREKLETEPVEQQKNSSGFTSRLASTFWRGVVNPDTTTSVTAQEATTPGSTMPPSPELRAQSLSPIPPSPLSLARGFTPEPTAASVNIWSYAEKLRDSDAAARLAKASTNWRVKALEAWSNRPSVPSHPRSAPTSPPSNASIKLPNVRNFSRRDSAASDSATSRYSPANSMRDPDSSYSPPQRPSYFRNPRDSLLVDHRAESVRSALSSPDLSPRSEGGSLASSSRSKHGGPRPLLLNSGSLMSSSAPTAEQKMGSEGAWRTKAKESMSSISSAPPTTYRMRSHRTMSRDSDSDLTQSRIVPLKRNTFSSVALSSRLGHSRPPSSSTASLVRNSTPRSAEATIQRRTMINDVDGHTVGERWPSPDSPTTLPSSPPPETPITSLSLVEGVRVSATEHHRGSVVLSDASDTAEDSPVTTIQTFIRRKTPPPTPLARHEREASDSSSGAPLRPTPRRQPRLRTRDNPTLVIANQRSTSPNSLAPPEWPHEAESSTTPRATEFEVAFPSTRRSRKISTEGNGEAQTRKLSGEGREIRTRKTSEVRVRKISNESRSSRRNRDSSAVEGDDEGYDDLLSAYESEGDHS